MATSYEEAQERVTVIGANLLKLIPNPDVATEHVTSTINEYRRAAADAVHANYISAHRDAIEDRLWDIHSKVNSRFRTNLKALRRRGPKNAVEIRKSAKVYLDFLKASQRFYRSFVADLDRLHGGIEELRKVAGQLDPKQVAHRSHGLSGISDVTRRRLVKSCYFSLIHLGDLSRYREAECNDGPPNYGPAVGYYNLAAEIYPQSGVAPHQLAIIALADSSHLKAIYHLYRSIAVPEPHPNGRSNLEIEFRKISQTWAKGELIKKADSRDDHGTNKALAAWFVRLHSRIFKGEESLATREAEEEVFSQLALEIRDRTTVDSVLQRFSIINIAAEWLVAQQVKDGKQDSSSASAFHGFLQLNLRTYTLLLQMLLLELNKLPASQSTEAPDSIADQISPVACRLLPSLNLYSSWMTKNLQVLSSNSIANQVTNRYLADLWRAYAQFLNKGATLLSCQKLPNALYILGEFVDTEGFLPLDPDRTETDGSNHVEVKPRYNDLSVQRLSATDEALVRIKGILVTGIELVLQTQIPIVHSNQRFMFQKDYDDNIQMSHMIQDSPTPTTTAPTEVISSSTPPRHVSPAKEMDITQPAYVAEIDATVPPTKDVRMHRMVDALVDDEDVLDILKEEDDLQPLTPPAPAYEDSPMIRNSSSGVANLLSNDMLAQVHAQHNKTSSNASTSGFRSSTASPFLASSRFSPQEHPLDGWSRPGSRSNQTSPRNHSYFGAAPNARVSTPNITSRGHSRNNSAASGPRTVSQHASDQSVTVNSSRSTFGNTAFHQTLPIETERPLSNIWSITPDTASNVWSSKYAIQNPQYSPLSSSALFGQDGYPIASDSGELPERNGSLGSKPLPHEWTSPSDGQGG